MKKSKRFLSLCMCIAMIGTCSNVVFAKKEETKTAPKYLTLNLEEAYSKALKDNLELKMMDDKITILDRIFSRAHVKAIDDRNSRRRDVESKKSVLIYAPRAAENASNAYKDKENKIDSLKTQIEKEYLNVINCEKDIENTNKTLKNLDAQMEKIKACIGEGISVENALKPLRLQKAQLLSSLNLPKAKKAQSMVKLKQYLNVDDSTSLSFINNKLNFEKFDDRYIYLDIQKGVKNSDEVHKMSKELEFAKLEVDIYEKYGRNILDVEDNKRIAVRDLENSFNNLKSTLQINIWNAYYGLKGKEESVNIQKVKLNNARERLDEAKVKFDNGLIDKLQLDGANLTFEKENIAYEKAVNEYMISVEELRNMFY